MAKLDEITALLVDEINGFEKSVEKLGALLEHIDDFKFEPETSGIEYLLKEHANKQDQLFKQQNGRMDKLLGSVKKSIVLPKWLVVLLWIFMMSIMVTLCMAIYQTHQIPKVEARAYKKGEEAAVGHFKQFFEQTPEASELYDQWLAPNDQE